MADDDNPKAPVNPRSFEIVNAQNGRVGTLSNQFSDLLVAAGPRLLRTHQGRGIGRDGKRTGMDTSFHSLRHTAVSLLKDAGVCVSNLTHVENSLPIDPDVFLPLLSVPPSACSPSIFSPDPDLIQPARTIPGQSRLFGRIWLYALRQLLIITRAFRVVLEFPSTVFP
jgi:hypothetical protein